MVMGEGGLVMDNTTLAFDGVLIFSEAENALMPHSRYRRLFGFLFAVVCLRMLMSIVL